MDILEFAMKMETDGKAFYEAGAAASDSPELKKILLTLAEEEQRHFNIFKRISEGQIGAAREFAQARGKTIEIAKNLFELMAEQGKKKLYGDDAKAMWQEAIKVEEKSERMYREQAEKETDETRKTLWNKIADEEKTHIYLIDNMISFMADPQSFVDSSQFANFKSWEGR